MLPKFDKVWPSLVLIGMLAFPVVVLYSIIVHSKIVSGKQVVFDRARSSLSAALNDFNAVGGWSNFVPKQYEYFNVCPWTNTIVIGGSNYQCALITVPQYDFPNNGNLIITANRVFIWGDFRH
jgi:hypothetical protein